MFNKFKKSINPTTAKSNSFTFGNYAFDRVWILMAAS